MAGEVEDLNDALPHCNAVVRFADRNGMGKARDPVSRMSPIAAIKVAVVANLCCPSERGAGNGGERQFAAMVA